MVRALRSAALVLVAFALASCSSNNPTSPVVGPFKSIVISAPTDTATYSTMIPFSATVVDTAGHVVSSPAISWSSSDPTVAVIDTRGVLTPKLEGSTTVLAQGGGATSNPVLVTVVPAFGWVDESSNAASLADLHGVYFIDRLHGWAVGALGTVLSTSNAGLTWHKQISNATNAALNAVFFPTGTHGFAVGDVGTIVESTDGGATWSLRSSIPTGGAGLNDIFFLGNKTGFIVGNSGVVLKTSDEGATWTRIQPIPTVNWLSVSATAQPGPDTTAWAVSAGGQSIDTEDGGATWQSVTLPFLGHDATGVTRVSRDQAFAVGLANYTAYTVGSPAGPGWVLAPTPAPATTFYGVTWPTAVQLMAVGETTGGLPTVMRSIDQGATWITQNLPSSAVLSGRGLRDVWFIDHDHGWAVGKSGVIVHTATGGDPL
jgi:photosystem II stability/assembly factor-like uncharacterized protein